MFKIMEGLTKKRTNLKKDKITLSGPYIIIEMKTQWKN